MVIVKRKWLVILLVCLLTAVLGLGITGYIYVGFACQAESGVAKILAERLLFFSIVLSLLLGLASIFLVLRGTRHTREIDKVIELNKTQEFSPERSLRKLGILGEKITTLYNQLNTISKKKTLKISALSALNTFLIFNNTQPVIITDIRGNIINCTENSAKTLGVKRAELLHTNISKSFPDMHIEDAVFRIDRSRSHIEKKIGKHIVGIYPIFNINRDIAYLVHMIDATPAIPEAMKQNQQNGTRPKRRWNPLLRFFPRAGQ